MKTQLSYCSFVRDGVRRFCLSFWRETSGRGSKTYEIRVLDDRTVEYYVGTQRVEKLPTVGECIALVRSVDPVARQAADLLALTYQSPEWRRSWWSIRQEVSRNDLARAS